MQDRKAFYRHVGKQIFAKRKERGLSQDSLARAVGLTRPTMSNIEKGRQNILLHTFFEIFETLNSSAKELLPELTVTEGSATRDLSSLPKEERDFVKAGIKNTIRGR